MKTRAFLPIWVALPPPAKASRSVGRVGDGKTGVENCETGQGGARDEQIGTRKGAVHQQLPTPLPRPDPTVWIHADLRQLLNYFGTAASVGGRIALERVIFDIQKCMLDLFMLLLFFSYKIST